MVASKEMIESGECAEYSPVISKTRPSKASSSQFDIRIFKTEKIASIEKIGTCIPYICYCLKD